MGMEINEELREHNRMLEKLDEDLDEAGEKMNFVMSKLGKLLKTKGKLVCQNTRCSLLDLGR